MPRSVRAWFQQSVLEWRYVTRTQSTRSRSWEWNFAGEDRIPPRNFYVMRHRVAMIPASVGWDFVPHLFVGSRARAYETLVLCIAHSEEEAWRLYQDSSVRTHEHTRARISLHTDTRTRRYTHERAQSVYVDIKPVMREMFDDNPVLQLVDYVVLLAPGEMPVESLGMTYHDTNDMPDNGIVTAHGFARFYLRCLAAIRRIGL